MVSGGADQNTVVGYCFAFRPSTGKALILHGVGAHSPNGSQAEIGPIAIPPVAGVSSGVLFYVGQRNDDWTGAAVLSGDGQTWVEMADASFTAYGDLGAVADYAIFSSTPSLTQKTFTITGGSSALGVGRAVTFKEVDPATGDYATTWDDWIGDCAGFAGAVGDYAASWDDWDAACVGFIDAVGDYSAHPWTEFTGDYRGVAGDSGLPEVIGDFDAAWDDWAVAAAALAHPPPATFREPRPTSGNDLMWVYDPETLTADLALDRRGAPAVSDDLRTAVVLSLGSDARAGLDDLLPDGSGDRRGWWGDAFPPGGLAQDRYGSLLWLLAREKQIPSVLARAEGYAREALAWLITDGIASRVEVVASFPALGWLGIEVAIHRPTAPPARYRFDLAWTAQAARSGPRDRP